MRIIFYILLICGACHVLAESTDSSLVESSSQESTASERTLDEAKRHNTIRGQLKAAEIAWENKDISVYPTIELVRMALTYNPSPVSNPIHEELTKRPEEVRSALLKELDSQSITFDVLYRIPFLAGIVDTEFQVEVAKRCLFRKEMKEADMALQIQEATGRGIFSLIAQSKYNETAVLDKMIDEGRLERGSDFEMKWRKLLSVGHRKEKNRAEKNALRDAQTGDRKTEGIPIGKEDSESSSDSGYLVAGGVIVLLGILALLFKVWKGKSER
jgi:hypothetical protein